MVEQQEFCVHIHQGTIKTGKTLLKLTTYINTRQQTHRG